MSPIRGGEYGKSPKTSEKDLKIPNLQPPD